MLLDRSAGHISAKRGDSKIMKMALAEPNCAAVNSIPNRVRSVALSANKVIEPPDCSNIDQNTVLMTMRKKRALIFPRSSESHWVASSQMNHAKKSVATAGSMNPTPLGCCNTTQMTKTDKTL